MYALSLHMLIFLAELYFLTTEKCSVTSMHFMNHIDLICRVQVTWFPSDRGVYCVSQYRVAVWSASGQLAAGDSEYNVSAELGKMRSATARLFPPH